jgi:hypothetical protein
MPSENEYKVYFAVKSNDETLALDLLSKYGLDTNAIFPDGKTVMEVACQNIMGMKDLIMTLISRGVDTNKVSQMVQLLWSMY